MQLPPPTPETAKTPAWNALLKRLLSAAIRVQSKGTTKIWMTEFVFYNSPLASSHPKEQGNRRPVYFQYEMGTADTMSRTVDALLSDWAQIVHIYSLVYDFTEYYAMGKYKIFDFLPLSLDFCLKI